MKPLGPLLTALSVSDCPGYIASNVVQTASTIQADLSLGGQPCDIYGKDLLDLKLLVEYQTDKRLHVKIFDAGRDVYQIQESIFPRPPTHDTAAASSELQFALTEKPFSFSVVRSATGDVLFNTTGEQLVFESQYVRLQTQLTSSPNIYGLGEHADTFRLPTEDYQRILWNVDSPDIPRRSNLYGSHPIYLDHRADAGSHGVFLLNANGMNINLNKTADGRHFLEYNTIGGVLDFYFLAGPGPSDVSQQYAEIVGLPAFPAYWTLGFHQCKYGYPNVSWVAEVVANYSAANIPLEVMWIDIDGMDQNQDFTVDPVNFPMPKMRELISGLHKNDQYFVTMLDPGIHRLGSYGPFARGEQRGVFLKALDGSDYRGIQWPGEVVWPDWFAPDTDAWWRDEILQFFDAATGLDVDGLWNDMNEVAQFCGDITCNPSLATAIRNGTAQPVPGFPYTLQAPSPQIAMRGEPGTMKGLPGRDLFTPPYQINNLRGALSASTLWTNVTNYDGTHQYDTHNLYGLGMVGATRAALLARRPGRRPFVLTRSTFAGAGAKAAHWFGDNHSSWADYRTSIAQMLAFTGLYQMPMVGSDVCGFNGDVEEKMCARWAMLGAFMPFYRNHANNASPPQEFYLWADVAAAARKAIDARYRLLDYIYTAISRAVRAGLPPVNSLMFLYPRDAKTFGIDLQFFLGDAILVSPVTEDESQSVTFYLPDDVFYDFWTLEQVEGKGATVTLDNVDFTSIPVHIRGGTVVPMRSQSANTTALLRKNNFTIVVAPGRDGKATGSLYLDDGESVDVGSAFSDISFSWDGTTFSSKGSFGYQTKAVIDKIVVLGKGGPTTHEGPWGLAAAFSIELGQGK